jgi:hypothetical protein
VVAAAVPDAQAEGGDLGVADIDARRAVEALSAATPCSARKSMIACSMR